MLNYFLTDLLSYVIVFAAVAGIVRFKRILKEYRPFVYLVWIALANEIISTLTIYAFRSNVANSNIYILAEYIMILWLFMRWDNLKRKRFYWLLLTGGSFLWVIDNCIVHRLGITNSFSRIFYSLVFVYLSVEVVNTIIFYPVSNLFLNAKFLICIAFIIYYSYRGVFEIFFFLQIRMSNAFYVHLFRILVSVNFVANLIYFFSMICIPKKQKFILVY